MKNSFIKAVVCLFCFSPWVQAQKALNIEDVVNATLIQTEGRSSVDWLEDGDSYSQIEKNSNGQWQVIACKAKGGDRQVLIPAEALVNPQTGKTISVRDFFFNKDHYGFLQKGL